MTFDPFVAAIEALPQAKLAALGREIDAQIRALQHQGEQVAQLLAEREGSGSTSPSARSRSPKVQKRAKRGVGKKRQKFIMQIVEGEPTKQWLPVDLEARLHAAGDTSATRDSVRNIVREMVRQGHLARHPSGNGVTGTSGPASTNGSDLEPQTEAQA